MKASLRQLAWYLERDGAYVARYSADGSQLIRVPALGGKIDYEVPGHMIDELNAERDRVYATLAAKRREENAR